MAPKKGGKTPKTNMYHTFIYITRHDENVNVNVDVKMFGKV
jgi:hypothetical protein